MFINSTVSEHAVASARKNPPKEQAAVPSVASTNASPNVTAEAILLIAVATVSHCALDAPEYTVNTSSPANVPQITGALVGKFASHKSKISLI